MRVVHDDGAFAAVDAHPGGEGRGATVAVTFGEVGLAGVGRLCFNASKFISRQYSVFIVTFAGRLDTNGLAFVFRHAVAVDGVVVRVVKGDGSWSWNGVCLGGVPGPAVRRGRWFRGDIGKSEYLERRVMRDRLGCCGCCWWGITRRRMYGSNC